MREHTKYQKLKASIPKEYVLDEDKAEFFVNTATKGGKILLPTRQTKAAGLQSSLLPLAGSCKSLLTAEAYTFVNYSYGPIYTDPIYIAEPIWSSITFGTYEVIPMLTYEAGAQATTLCGGGGAPAPPSFFECVLNCLTGDPVAWSLFLAGCGLSCVGCVSIVTCIACALCAASLGWSVGQCALGCMR